MAELDVLTQPQRQKRRQEEYRLELERKRNAEEDHAQCRALLEAHIQRHQTQGGIDRIALTPVRAVEHNRRQQGSDVENRQLRALTPDLQAAQLHHAVSHQHLKGNGNRLDQILPRIRRNS